MNLQNKMRIFFTTRCIPYKNYPLDVLLLSINEDLAATLIPFLAYRKNYKKIKWKVNSNIIQT